ncbi:MULTISPECIES: carboxymuconolactone decarboxylase family protein [unclassified Beijerinckia]|uniref:carboxymuconolactone decarboxylase family protein n=1 Tax=unclassified Beijerinckia TaxID=2638183 RepID=UPI000897BA4C|nr:MULTISPECIES: carboxymuconolactone decarboxylase family protein [unclassified Beijerinckia]MDH7796965.1 4-carboxymuconolactone decarboxylase [Beijerinckia sp. GAS462]SEC66861.1 4-carboxymuconolactone decarboxylase [Beijerinckia sp. 28-YEA-48]
MKTGARISLPDTDGMNDAQRRVFDGIVNGKRGELVGPLRAALHNPELAERWSKLGESLRFQTRIPPRLSELAVLMTARALNSDLEWGVHRRAAETHGLETEIIEALRDGRVPPFQDAADREIYRFVSELLARAYVEDKAYAAVVARWGDGGVMELTALVGYYCMVAMTLNVHRIPLPQGVAAELLPAPGQFPKGFTALPPLVE